MGIRLGGARWLALALALVVLVGLGAFGLTLVSSANRAAEAALGEGAVERQRTVSLLTDQYLKLAALRLLEVDDDPRLELAEGSDADAARLRELIREPAGVFDHGAAVTDLTGRPLTLVGTLPDASDPGYVPLRAGLLRGEPGVSAVMHPDGVPVVAIAVPLLRQDAPAALLVAAFRADTGALQQYSQHLTLGTDAAGMVLDGQGTIVAARTPEVVGTTWDDGEAMAAVRSAPSGHTRMVRDGREVALTWAPIETGGWTLLEEASAAAFYASAHDQSTMSRLLVLGLLLAGGLGAVFLDHRTDRARRQGAQRAEALVRDAHDVITIVRDGKVAYVSPALDRVLGHAPDALVGTDALGLVHPDDLARVEAAVLAASEPEGGRQRIQARVRRADGGFCTCEVAISNRTDDPTIRGTIVSLRDVSEVAALHEQLSHQALHDPLTGLPNRVQLERRLADALDVPGTSPAVAVLFLDLDGFKAVNDEFGHDVGDDLLGQVAERLQGCVREDDVLARLGGDEFVMVCRSARPRRDATQIADRILEMLSLPFAVGPWELSVGASIGIAVANGSSTPTTLLREADAAMYRAKAAGRCRYELTPSAPPVG